MRLRPSARVADEVPGGRVHVPDALLGAQRGQQHLSLSPDQSAEIAEGRQRRVRGERLHAEDVAVVPARGSGPRRGLGPHAGGRARAVDARRAGGRAQEPTPPVVLLSARQRRAERAPRLPDDRVRGRLSERRGNPGVLSVRAVREINGQRFHRHRTGVPERGRRLLAQLGVGHVAQMVAGAGHHGPETPDVRLYEKTGGIRRRGVRRNVGHQTLLRKNVVGFFFSVRNHKEKKTLLYLK